jgi:Thioredoxin-like domain
VLQRKVAVLAVVKTPKSRCHSPTSQRHQAHYSVMFVFLLLVMYTCLQAANADDDHQYGVVTDVKVIKAFGAEDGSVLVLKTFDEGKNTLPTSSSTSVDDISAFVSTYTLPLVTKFSTETSRAIFGGPVQVHALFFTKEEEISGEMKEAATEVRASLHVQLMLL